MEHGAGSDAHTHPGIAATDGRADASPGAPGDPAALIDANTHANGARACADSHVNAATADPDAQRDAREDGHPDAYPCADGGAGGKTRTSETDRKESDWQ